MNRTIKLLKIMGSPYSAATEMPKDEREALELYFHATKNRIPLLYLETLMEKNDSPKLGLKYKKQHEKYLKTYNVIAKFSHLLSETNINHAVFKTIRPYPFTTIDIDVLVFGETGDYIRATKVLHQAGYENEGFGPRTGTFYDTESKISIDLHEEIAVSRVTYLNKLRLSKHVRAIVLPNGRTVKTLTAEADLVAVIAHSVIKENMFTLCEFYTFLYHLSTIKKVKNLVELIKENNIRSAAQIFFVITATLHMIAHGEIPQKLIELIGAMGISESKICKKTMTMHECMTTPYKYHTFAVARAFLEKTREREVRENMVSQVINMLRPSFTKDVITKAVRYIRRETY